MRKIAMLALSCAVLLGTSCSKDNNENAAVAPGGMVLEISAMETLQARADLYSSQAVQSVESVNIYVFQESGSDYLYLKTYNISGWTKGSTFKRYDVPSDQMIPAGGYKFIAVGRDLTDNFTLPTLNGGSTSYNDLIASVASAGMETEIFSGSANVAVSSQGVRVPITMTRQVAGVLGYFKNVPVEINGQTVKYLRLSIDNSNTNVNLNNGIGTIPTGVSHNIIDMDLSSQTPTGDGVYSGNDLDAQGIVKVANSQLSGAFVIPVNNVTFTLGLYDASDAPLKTWNVLNGQSSTFNIAANNFYSLGVKASNTTTTGTPENPTPDDPIDLLTDQSIAITIQPNWAAITELDIQ